MAHKHIAQALLSVSILLSPMSASAEAPVYRIEIKDHKFSPEALEVPAGQKVKLEVVNNDATAEEFESYELNREKIIKGNSSAIIFIGPLEPGSYPYFGEFNMDTAKGTIIAK